MVEGTRLESVRRLTPTAGSNPAPSATFMHESEITKAFNKIIQGDWNWPYDKDDTWHGEKGEGRHIMLYGDGHVDQFVFPPSTTMTNWLLKPAPDPNYTWW